MQQSHPFQGGNHRELRHDINVLIEDGHGQGFGPQALAFARGARARGHQFFHLRADVVGSRFTVAALQMGNDRLIGGLVGAQLPGGVVVRDCNRLDMAGAKEDDLALAAAQFFPGRGKGDVMLGAQGAQQLAVVILLVLLPLLAPTAHIQRALCQR